MKLDKNLYLCLDVGFRNTGWAVWNEITDRFIASGVIQTDDDETGASRLDNNVAACRYISKRLATIIGKYSPCLILGEFPTGASRNARAVACMSLATGITVTTAALLDVPLVAISPFEVKRVVNPKAKSHGKSVEKEEVIRFIISKHGEAVLPSSSIKEHVADAMACIYAYKARS